VRVAVTAVRVASQPLPLAQARNWECSALTAGAVQSYGAGKFASLTPSALVAMQRKRSKDKVGTKGPGRGTITAVTVSLTLTVSA
jgi:hypothetical protein